MTWGPWTHHLDGRPDPGDYIQLKCPCFDHFHEGIYMGDTEDGHIRIAPNVKGTWYCYWRRVDNGVTEEEEHKEEVTA